MTSKTVEWLNKWQDYHDLGGITVGEIKADLAAVEKDRDRQKGAAESWKDSYRECLARVEVAEKERDRYREITESCGRRLMSAADKLELCEILHKSETARAEVAEAALKRYGQHEDTCLRRQIGTLSADPACTCGLAAILEVTHE